jgi:hypothetical protein
MSRVARWEVVWRSRLRKKGPRETKGQQQKKLAVVLCWLTEGQQAVENRKPSYGHNSQLVQPRGLRGLVHSPPTQALSIEVWKQTHANSHPFSCYKLQHTPRKKDYRSTLANSTLIILFSEMLKFSKIISSELKNIVKDNGKYLGILHLFKWIFQT